MNDTEEVVHGFRGPEACSYSGVTYRQLDYWCRTDLVVPSVRAAAGSGTQRLYSRRDVVALAVCRTLLDAGLSLRTVREALPALLGALFRGQGLEVDDAAYAMLPLSPNVTARIDLAGIAAGIPDPPAVRPTVPPPRLAGQQ